MAKRKVRVGISGIGNCASALVQGVQFYQNAPNDQSIPGLMNPVLGGYHIRDIEFSATIDIAKNKVGKDLSEAIWEEPSVYFMKSQPVQYSDDVAKQKISEFIAKHSH